MDFFSFSLMAIPELLNKLKTADSQQEFKRVCAELQPLLLEAKNLAFTEEYRRIVQDFKRTQSEQVFRRRADLFTDAKLTRRSFREELQDTVGMLDNEVQKGEANYQELDLSSRTMEKTGLKLESIDGSLGLARKALQSMVAKDQKDRHLLYFGVGIFLSTCFYIFLKRIW